MFMLVAVHRTLENYQACYEFSYATVLLLRTFIINYQEHLIKQIFISMENFIVVIKI